MFPALLSHFMCISYNYQLAIYEQKKPLKHRNRRVMTIDNYLWSSLIKATPDS
jgi:hypothetical protein